MSSDLQTNGLVLFLVFFVWGHAQVVLGFFLANFFGRPRTATIVGYVLVIAGVIVALMLEALKVRVAGGSVGGASCDRGPCLVLKSSVHRGCPH